MSYYGNNYRFSQPRRRATPVPNAHPDVVQAWRDANPAAWDWMETNAKRDNEFACSLIGHLNRKGTLTDGQHAAVDNAIVRDRTRTADRIEREHNAPAAEAPEIEAAFVRARAAGIKRPRMILADFRFSAAPMSGANPGAIYVKAMDDTSTYLGKVANGRFVRSRDCTPALANDAMRVMADPRAAAIAHGKQYGICSCCGRELTDPQSVIAGIGPVCAKNYGWAR